MKKIALFALLLITSLSSVSAQADGYGRYGYNGNGHRSGYSNNRGWGAPAVIGGVIVGAIVGSALTTPYYSRPSYYAPMPGLTQQQPIIIQQQPIIIQQQPLIVQQRPIIVQQQPLVVQQQSNAVDSYYPVMQLAPPTITAAPSGYRWQMMVNPQNNIAQPVLVPNH
jgi:hypothetical protein